MWGLYALEDIPANTYICTYLGELITDSIGYIREGFTMIAGMSYTQTLAEPIKP
jgi:hypothetical protein